MEWVKQGHTHMHTHAHILTPFPLSPSPSPLPSCCCCCCCSSSSSSFFFSFSFSSYSSSHPRFIHPPAANIIQPLPGNKKCKLTMLTQVDPGGFAPPVLINHVRIHYYCLPFCRLYISHSNSLLFLLF